MATGTGTGDALRASLAASAAEAARLAAWLRDTPTAHDDIAHIASRLAGVLSSGGRILTCGNGGSMCDAMHFAQELSGFFREKRPALAAMAISDPSHLTCVANDAGFDQVFARGVEAWGRSGDALIVISTSGTSANIVAAAQTAKRHGLLVVGLLGKGGGATKALCDLAVDVPGATADRIQELHITIVHLLIEQIEAQLRRA